MSLQPGGQFDFMELMRRRAMTGISAPSMIPQTAPNPTMGGGLGQRIGGGIKNGLGKLQAGMFPVDPSLGLNPEQAKAMQGQAMMQMGLGILSSNSQGAGLGQSLAHGYGQAQHTLQGSMQRGFENAQMKQAQARADNREDRQMAQQELAEQRYQTTLEHQQKREEMEAKRYESEQTHELEREKVSDQRWQAQQALDVEKFKASVDGATRSPEVRVTDRGMFERDPKTGEWNAVPGTEPTGVSGRPIPQGMANDLKTNASVMNQIDKLLPQIVKPGENATPEQRKAFEKAEKAFGARNATIDMLTPDAVSDNFKNWWDPEGTDIRATVTNLNSYIVKERNGAAVTIAEFARQRGFLPTDKDERHIVETKLKNLRKAISDEQQYMLDFAESQGYRPPPSNVRPSNESTSPDISALLDKYAP